MSSAIAAPTPPPPPPGVTPNFNASSPNGTTLIAISIIAIVCTTAVVITRLYTKAFLTRALGWDDITCVLSLIGAFIYTACNCELGRHGLGAHDYERRYTIKSYEYLTKIHWMGEFIYFATTGLMKVSILLLYLRIFSQRRSLRFAVYAALAAIVASHITTLIITTFDIVPLECHWWYLIDEVYDAKCKERWDDTYAYIFMSVFTIALDMLILAIPCPAVWKLNMPKQQKIGVMAIFAAGLLVTVASVLRLIFIVQWIFINQDNDYLLWEYKVNLSGTFEVNLGIICASLTTMKAFLRRFAPSIFGLTSASRPNGIASQTHRHSSNNHVVSRHLSKPGRKGPIDSGEEELTNAVYLELREDGKSDQSYGMTAAEVHPRSA